MAAAVGNQMIFSAEVFSFGSMVSLNWVFGSSHWRERFSHGMPPKITACRKTERAKPFHRQGMRGADCKGVDINREDKGKGCAKHFHDGDVPGWASLGALPAVCLAVAKPS